MDIAPIVLDQRLRELEASLISWALKVTNGNKSHAARLLGIKRSTLGDRIVRCGLRDMTLEVDGATSLAHLPVVTSV